MTDKNISSPLGQEYEDENYLAEPCFNRIYEESHLNVLKTAEYKLFSFENGIDPEVNFLQRLEFWVQILHGKSV